MASRRFAIDSEFVGRWEEEDSGSLLWSLGVIEGSFAQKEGDDCESVGDLPESGPIEFSKLSLKGIIKEIKLISNHWYIKEKLQYHL